MSFTQNKNTDVIYINLSSDKYKLGGSAFGQIINKVERIPSIKDSKYFKNIQLYSEINKTKICRIRA